MSPWDRNGATARIVVSEVMTMAFRRRRPASMMACLSAMPSRRRRIDGVDLEDRVVDHDAADHDQPDHRHQVERLPEYPEDEGAPKRSMTISERMIHGWTSDSNCAARMKKKQQQGRRQAPR